MNEIIEALQEEFLSRLSRTTSSSNDASILILKSYLDARLDIIQTQLDQLIKNES